MHATRLSGGHPTSKFRTDIQGLRAIAVLAVVVYHAGAQLLPGGYVGVDIFFVISGFLITSHLLSGLRRDGRVHFAAFYAKRARRILPASFVVLALSLVLALAFYPPLLIREVWQGAGATAFYVPNMLFAYQGTDYLAEATPSLFQHYWSLGVEEQFYLIWPLLLALGFVWTKRPKVLLAIVVAVVVTSFTMCVLLTFRAQPWAFFALPFRAWELGVGGITAFLLTYRPRAVTGTAACVLGWVGVTGIIASAVLFSGATPFPGFWAAMPVLATAAVIVAGDSRAAGSPYSLLSLRPVVFIGTISYSLYLVHWPLLQLTQAAVGAQNPLPLWATVLLAVAGVPLAWLMFRYVEQPALKRRWLAAKPHRSLLAAGGASLSVALIATALFTASNARELNSGEAAPPTEVVRFPTFTQYVPMNLTPGLRSVSDDQPAIYDDGCHADFATTTIGDCVYGDPAAPRIVLFGDSHAAQWFPAVLGYAEENGFAVESHTKSSCPSVSVDVIRDGVEYSECEAWRDLVIEEINASEPELVVLSNYGTASLIDTSESYAAVWSGGLRSSLERIEPEAVVIGDTPGLATTPSVCLSANLTSASACGSPRPEALGSPARRAERTAAETQGTAYLDLSDYFCDEARCDPIIGDTLVYRDAHHMTATFSEMLAEPLSRELLDLR